MADRHIPERWLPGSNDEIMPGAEPMYFDQGKIGFLFLHGFTGSTYEGRDFALHFAEKGYAVWVPLLPGHGTKPEHLETINYKDWIQAAEAYYQQMREYYQTVIVCGQSMGGALALHLAANHPVEAVVSLAGAVFLKDWRLKLLPLAKRLIRFQYKSKGPDIRCKAAKQKAVSYHKYPIKSLIQFLELISFVKSELPKITCPAFLVHSRRDHTITYENLAYIAEHIASDAKQTLTLENSYHVISVDQERETIFEGIEKFLQANLNL